MVLRSSNVEPSIRRSALNQISVMMDDVLLHRVFLDAKGLEIILPILETALTEKNYTDYPDAVIPITSILKNLCFHQATVRDELSNNMEVFYWILRGLFLFFTEEQMKQDTASLLFLLIFKDFLQGDPSRGDFSVPDVVTREIKVPFQCSSHWNNSPNAKQSLKGEYRQTFFLIIFLFYTGVLMAFCILNRNQIVFVFWNAWFVLRKCEMR